MQTTSEGLRRSAYAGVMLREDGKPTDVVWLAVPFLTGASLPATIWRQCRLSAPWQHWCPAGLPRTIAFACCPETRKVALPR